MAILYGTQSNGETLPVLVDQYGNLIAKGIDGAPGEPGEPGPPGPPGGEFPLPPGATDGALLGWQDGELVWVTGPAPPLVPGFRPIIWTGNGATQSISGLGFSPDFVWIKARTRDESHALFDTIRGATNLISSNARNVENSQPQSLSTFDSDGFSVGSEGNVNQNTHLYVAYCWNTGDAVVTNNDGTIQSQVRSNGNFSVIKYIGDVSAGSTFGHGLDNAPAMVFFKCLGVGHDWIVYHKSVGANAALRLNDESATDRQTTWFNDTQPNSTVITVGATGGTNENNTNMVAYAWAETPGVSSFGQYSGTGSRFQISTGFRPSLVIIKSIAGGNWFMFDNARGVQQTLRANLADREDQTGVIEFLDNGFQVLFALPGINQSNVSYIYAAFANPEDAAFARKKLRRQARQEKRQQNETQPR